MDIDDWRREIDRIDLEMLRLLNDRAQFSINIGKIKMQRDLPIHSPEREMKIIQRVVKENKGPLGSGGVQRIYERVIDESRRIEKKESKILEEKKIKEA
jgi:chorismate mutase